MQTPKLKPCPFCGGRTLAVELRSEDACWAPACRRENEPWTGEPARCGCDESLALRDEVERGRREISRLQEQHERWQSALDSFEQASEVACADAERAEAECERLRGEGKAARELHVEYHDAKEAELGTLRARVAELEGALRPWADVANEWPDDEDYQRAARALGDGE